jgi:nucleoid DNA-binding protein
MNLQKWAKSTHLAIAKLPRGKRQNNLSARTIERVLQISIMILVAKLVAGESVRIDELGRFWVEEEKPRTYVSNLRGKKRIISLQSRRVLRFRASAYFLRRLNTSATPAHTTNP